jgi:hypothetical protein
MLAAVGTLAVAAIGIGFVGFDSGAREFVLNDRPEARADAYLSAIRRGDLTGALAVWELDVRERPGIAERRQTVTTTLAAARPSGYRIDRIEWWTTCCDPQRTEGPRNAGLARITVTIDPVGTYVLDVLARTTTYWGDAGGNPPHDWTLRDVYEASAKPLFFMRAD